MTKEDENLIIGGGIGALIAWLLLRKKPAATGGIMLSNLTIDPTGSYYGNMVTIAVDASNPGGMAASADIVAQAGNTVFTTPVSLNPGQSSHLSWDYQVESASLLGVDTMARQITVAVSPQRGSITIINPD
jgi:hypothetical protein